MNYYYNEKLITNADVFPYIKGVHLKSFPLPQLSYRMQKYIANKVDQLLGAIENDNSELANRIKRELDIDVFHLYGLTYEEVLIVNPDFSMQKEEYLSYEQ